MSIHKGHRERMKEEFLQAGLDHFSDVRALELLLFHSRLQGDVNPIAHRLLDTFGSFSGVLDASPEQLLSVTGVGKNTAVLLKLVTSLGRKYLVSRTGIQTTIHSTKDMKDLFSSYFFGAKNEMAFVAVLDDSNRVLGVRKMDEGIPNSIALNPRKIVEIIVTLNGTRVLLAHNHLNRISTPSNEDLLSTSVLQEFLSQMDITLLDHLIFIEDDFFSMRDRQYLR